MRIGIVGISTRHWPVAIARNLASLRDVRLLAAATLGDSEATVRQHIDMSPTEFSEAFAVKLYREPEEMVERERLDTVVISTRHSQHAEFAERMAGLGMNIYIPKTFTTTIEDAERIVRAGRKRGAGIAVGPSGRHFPPIAAAKKAVEKGIIGEPFAMRLSHHHGTLDAFPEGDWYRDVKEGGPELSLGWYVIDLLLDFMGQSATSVYATYGNYTSPGSPFMDCGKMVLRLKNGGMASCDMYFCHRIPYPTWELEVAGPKGVIKVQAAGNGTADAAAWLYTARGPRPLPVPKRIPDREVFWVDDFKKNRPPAISAEDALEITRISVAALDSARKGRPVML